MNRIKRWLDRNAGKVVIYIITGVVLVVVLWLVWFVLEVALPQSCQGPPGVCLNG